MTDNQQIDPSGTTAQFRAYAQGESQAPAKRSPAPIVAGIVVAVVVVALVVWLLVR
ncbi:hypothetical protein [Rugosimonospora africana]|uniref:Uncharacterized protein n=1 Tax=Rugosimonospora africana TaxID=556532 RepID=A0A8J3QJ26_9ACTN|nr:hypothetical protein [Rugosimonospora africana]GIH11984.1 hypothetical protein Raf01_01560 [Rugosimonospora africana]